MILLRTTAEIARQTFLLLLRSRILLLLVLFALAVPAIAVIVAQEGRPKPGREVFAILGFWMHMTVLVPWSAVFFGVHAVHGDIEDRSFQYLFLRPVPRPAILFGKWLAAAAMAALLAVFGFAVLFTAVAWLPLLWPGSGVEWRLLPLFAGVGAVAAAAYAAVAALLGAWFRRPMIWAVFFIVGLEYFVANLPPEAGVRSLTIADPVRRMLLDGLEPGRRLARALWPSQRDLDLEQLGNPQGSLLLLIAVCLALAMLFYGRSEYDSRARD